MIKDPFGDWDWDGIRQLASIIIFLVLVISFAASTSGDWSDPWMAIYDLLADNAPLTIGLTMVGLMGLWWHEQFRGGAY